MFQCTVNLFVFSHYFSILKYNLYIITIYISNLYHKKTLYVRGLLNKIMFITVIIFNLLNTFHGILPGKLTVLQCTVDFKICSFII